jgi:hypothetical protein
LAEQKNKQINDKIVFYFRLNYLKDNVLAHILEERTLAAFNIIGKQVLAEIVFHFASN